jgi:hypothetical protein
MWSSPWEKAVGLFFPEEIHVSMDPVDRPARWSCGFRLYGNVGRKSFLRRNGGSGKALFDQPAEAHFGLRRLCAMIRSQINSIMRSAEAFIRRRGIHLPPFTHWTPKDWGEAGDRADGIISSRLGWDKTDFGSENYTACGLFLVTPRIGSPENRKRMQG